MMLVCFKETYNSLGYIMCQDHSALLICMCMCLCQQATTNMEVYIISPVMIYLRTDIGNSTSSITCGIIQLVSKSAVLYWTFLDHEKDTV